MTFKDGRYVEDEVEQVVEAMIADAKEEFGNDLNDDETAAIRLFYRPIAEKIVDLQEDIGLVLDSSQIEYASGRSLDLLTALIGVSRQEAIKATGSVDFSRSTNADKDYTIPSGTGVETSSATPIKFVTTESVTLASGTKSVTANVEAVNGGTGSNVSSNTVTEFSEDVNGVEEVNNPSPIDGGEDREPDTELRSRAKKQLADGSRASASALINATSKVEGVKSVSIFINDTNTDNTGSGGLPDHSFELVVENGNKQDIGQAILDTKAAGDTSYSGANGTAVTVTADLPNGQTHDIDFSRPNQIKIYVDADISVTDEFAGKDAIRDSIVNYIGGILSTGGDEPGDLHVGDDVIHGEVEFAMREIDGVYDVPRLDVDTVSGGTNSSNISIADSEVATSDATDGTLTFTKV